MTNPHPPTIEDIRQAVREELAPVEERLTERIVAVEREVGEVKADLAALRRDLVGVIDERFPPIGTRSQGRSMPATGVAAKPR